MARANSRVVPAAVRHLVLVVAALVALTAAVRAQADLAKATDRALAQVQATEKKRAAKVAERAQLDQRYKRELAAIDRLKRQKASWRRDSQLRTQLSASLETAKKLGAATNAIALLDGQLARQRRALVAAIDAELATAGDARARTLRGLRAEVAPRIAPKKAKKIVLPDDELDLLAAPEELDQQADAMRATEAELLRQLGSLEKQAARFKKQAELRKQHQRAGELASRDDSQPRRTSGAGSRSANEAGPEADDAVDTSSEPPPSDEGPASGGLSGGDLAVVLSDVVDAGTVDALRKAERSSDPAAKAAAAERARAQVEQRLRALEKRRKEIEKRAKELRQ